MPYLKGIKKDSPHEFLFWRQYDQKNYAVIHQTVLKELIWKDTNVSMNNLKMDIGEQTNVAEKHTSLLQQMEQQRKKWEANTTPPAFFGLNQADEYKAENKSKQKD